MAKGFKVDNMTVEEILNMPIMELQKLNQRELSRALRTVALAANKRVKRLLNNAELKDFGYVAKPGKSIATDALNWVTNNGQTTPVFGVKQAKNYNQMSKQFAKIKKFWHMQSSTVGGAGDLQTRRMRSLFGREYDMAIAKARKQKKSMTKVKEKFANLTSDVWSAYHLFLELEGRDVHSYYEGSTGILEFIASNALSGGSTIDLAMQARKRVSEDYEAEQETMRGIYEGLSGFEE